MQMEVEDGLTGCRSFVEAHIEAIWTKPLGDYCLALVDSRPDRGFFDRAKVRPGGRVPPGNNEKVTGIYGKPVPEGDYEIV